MTPKNVRALTLLVVIAELFVRIIAPDPISIGQCTKVNACSCVYDDGTIVNLKSFDRTDGKPNFANVTNSAQTEFYSWNPCTPFSYPSTNAACENVAVCMIRQSIPRALFYDLGKQDSAQFMVDSNGTLKLTYTSDQGDYKRVSEITLQCLENSKFDFFVAEGEQPEANNTVLYKLTLASKYACAKAPAVETTSISVCNDTTEPTFSTTSKPTPDSSSNLPDHSNISTQRYYSTATGSSNFTTTSSNNNFSPSLIGSAWIIMCHVVLVVEGRMV